MNNLETTECESCGATIAELGGAYHGFEGFKVSYTLTEPGEGEFGHTVEIHEPVLCTECRHELHEWITDEGGRENFTELRGDEDVINVMETISGEMQELADKLREGGEQA